MPKLAQAQLTDRAVAAIKLAGDQRREIADAGLPGLSLRASASSKVFWFRYRGSDGRQARIRLGNYVTPEHAKGDPDALTVAGARIKARKLRSAVDDGLDPGRIWRAATAKARAQPIKTLDDLSAAFFSVCESGEYRPSGKVKKASTLAGERYSYKTYIKPELGCLRVEDVTRDLARELLRDLAKRGAGVTSNRVRALLHSMMHWAVVEGRIPGNPIAAIPRIVAEKPRERVVSDEELKAIWACLTDPSRQQMPDGKPLQVGRPVRLALKLAILTMQRRAEIAGLRVADVDLDAGIWTIPAELNKASRAHVVPLGPASIALIKEALSLRALNEDTQSSPYVFPGHRDRTAAIKPAALSQAMRDIRAALGIEDVTPHDLRRSGASRLADAGVNPFSISLALNHAGGSGAASVTMRHYVRAAFMPERTEAMMTLERLVLRITGYTDR